jgi:hypothetical protein
MIGVVEFFKCVGIAFLTFDHAARRVVEFEEDYIKIAAKFGRRQGDKMNFVSGLLLAESEAVKVSAFVAKLPTYLPLIQKNIADLQKAASDKSDPTALMGDVSTLLADLNSDLSILSSVLPALTPTPAPAA